MIRILVFIIPILSSLTALAFEARIGYQTGVEPAKVAIADQAYEKATGNKIIWRRFDNGAELIRAVAAGDIDIANIGSSVVASAASQGVEIKTFLIASELKSSEALVVQNKSHIQIPQDLIGKTIAVPFASTSHYSLLAALKHWGIDRTKVKIISLRVSEIPAAWETGIIDAAYVWDPALSKIKATGKVLTSSAEVAEWGAPTFDVWVSTNRFAQNHADFLKKFSKVSLDYYLRYQLNAKKLHQDSAYIQKISQVTGADTSQIVTLLQGNLYPLAQRQKQLLSQVLPENFRDSALFLKQQGKIERVLDSYKNFSTAQYIE